MKFWKWGNLIDAQLCIRQIALCAILEFPRKVVRSDKPDHEVWPQVNVELLACKLRPLQNDFDSVGSQLRACEPRFESATEAENEVEECFQHLALCRHKSI